MAGSEGSPRLTVRDRILVHLAEYPSSEGAYQVPRQLSQVGVVEAVGIKLSHLPQYVRPMMRAGLVGEQLARVESGKQRRKTYFLTPQGRNEASRIRGNILGRSVELVEADGRRAVVVLREAVKGPMHGVTLLDLVHVLETEGFLRVGKRDEDRAASRIEPGSVQALLDQASRREEASEWLEAAGLYQEALTEMGKHEGSIFGGVHARTGHALFKAAFQADHFEDFSDRLKRGVQEYQRAQEEGGPWPERGEAWTHYCNAWLGYLEYWLASDVATKRPPIAKAWEQTRLALRALKAAHATREYGNAYNELALSAILRLAIEWDPHARKALLQEAVELGEEAIRCLTDMGNANAIASARARTAAYLLWLAYYFVDIDKRDQYHRRALAYWAQAGEEGTEAALAELPIPFFKGLGSAWGDGSDQSLAHLEKALEPVKKTKDKFLIGSAFDWLAFHSFLKVRSIENPHERIAFANRALEYAEAARGQFAPIAFLSPRGGSLWTGAPHAEFYWSTAGFETDLWSKRDLLAKASAAAQDQLQVAERTGCPEVVWLAHDVLCRTLVSLAEVEADSAEKKRMLEQALEHEHESRRIAAPLLPFCYGIRGNVENLLAEIKSGLAALATDPETRRGMLEEAIAAKQSSLELCSKEIPFLETWGAVTDLASLGHRHYQVGTLFLQLHELTKEKGDLKKATDAFRDAATSFEKAGLPTRIAECHWKAAQTLDAMGDHWKAAEQFASSSDFFRIAAARMPNLESLYSDHALYMQAWCEIEKAHHHHARREYGQAKEFYERAATLHKFSKNWGFLTPNYSAWAQVEYGEELSRMEPERAAIQAFEQAATLFQETKLSISTGLRKDPSQQEAMVADGLIRTAELRRQYCIARVSFEEARLLEKRGELSASSDRYALAAEGFEEAARAMESEQDRRDISLIATLSRAWETMTKAEAEASSELYGKASLIFDEAQNLSSHEKVRMLALGHSRFCRALEAGTKYMDRRDGTTLAATIRHLEAAGNYYLRAGVQGASDYAQASKMLFQAYSYMDNASVTDDQEEKTKFYLMTERVLQASGAAFAKAGHAAKEEEVLRLQDRVREDRDLAVSLTQVLRAPAIMAATTPFSTSSPTQERAVGLERFENADVWMVVRAKEWSPKVGQSFPLQVEMTNAGKGLAQLIKIQDMIPEGFELSEEAERSHFAGRDLTMKGFRLEPLKTLEENILVTPGRRGLVILKPKLLFVGDDGRHREFEPPPQEISVD